MTVRRPASSRDLLPALMLACGACTALLGPDDYRLELAELTVPAEIAVGAEAVIQLRYQVGGCEYVHRIRQVRRSNLLIIDVRGLAVFVPAGAACSDVLRNVPDSIRIPVLSPGDYTVWGMRRDGDPFVAPLRVVAGRD